MPTLLEIIDGLISAFIQYSSEKNAKTEYYIENYKDAWKAIFKIGTLNFDLNKEIDHEILRNADHPVSKTLIYIHSMETFIYKDLTKACLNRDFSRVKTLGPYAWAIG